MKRRNCISNAAWAVIALITVFAGSSPGISQPVHSFLKTYGSLTKHEAGYFRVIPVIGNCATTVPRGNGCSAGSPALKYGYLAVGYTDSNSSNTGTDAFVVRTDDSGVVLWEKFYDVAGKSKNDTAFSVVELAGHDGFAVMGTSEVPKTGGGTQTDIFLMKLDCDGNVSWVKLYGNTGTNEYGRDILQATGGTGSQLTGYTVAPSINDFVLAGWTDGGASGSTDGVLIRVNSTGVRAWDSRYDLGGVSSTSQETFQAIWESQITEPGDILVCGIRKATSTSTTDGLIGRVDGPTGGVVALTKQGFAVYGSTSNEELYSIIEPAQGNAWNAASNQAYWGGIVATGKTTSGTSGTDDIYIVALPSGELCQSTPAQQQYYYDYTNGSNSSHETARCIREIDNGTSFTNLGLIARDFMLTGYTTEKQPTVTTANDAFFLPIQVAATSLTPAGGQVYGDIKGAGQTNNEDRGFSIAEVPATHDGYGAVICGYAESHPCDATEPRDLMIVKTDDNGVVVGTTCSESWSVNQSNPSWNESCITPTIVRPFLSDLSETPTSDCMTRSCLQCENYALAPKRSIGENGEPTPGIAETSIAISPFPNPIKPGNELTVSVTSSIAGPITLSIVNSLGQTIWESNDIVSKDARTALVETVGWPAGSYLVKAAAGGVTSATRLVVIQ